MSRREKKPNPIVRKTPRGLTPVASFFAEAIFADPIGTEYDLVKRARRSHKQNATYWKALSLVVDNDDRWATSDHLHDALKRACGRVSVIHDLSGKPFLVTDSTGFDAMTQEEFQAYFDQSMAKLAEAVGYDPLSFLAEAA